ncbi:hypothetical protein ATCC90586_007836 [Pythium insidiosum]|nr:hypothetical protein ATCC90586_007836 [Pythium insidiosum]
MRAHADGGPTFRRASLSIGGREDIESASPTRRRSIDAEAADVNEAAATNLAYMWSLLLATLAECITTCFVPEWYLEGWKVNITATVINLVGPFLDGMSYGYEDGTKPDAQRLPFLEFRAAFLGVFTSYSFMVDHAGDLTFNHPLHGPTYIVGTVVGACGTFHIGRLLIRGAWLRRIARQLSTSKPIQHLPSFLFAANVFIILTVLRAMFGRPGDPNDPQFIGPLRVADGEELMLGILMSCSGILIAEFLEDRFRPRPDAKGRVSVLDWGNLVCNFLACWLTFLAYEASRLSPNTVKNNLLVMKFVSSFCGSISCFSESISHIMRIKTSAALPDALVQRLHAKQQQHVLKFYEADKLSDDETQQLAAELEALDLDYLDAIFEASTAAHAQTPQKSASIEPLDEFEMLETSAADDKHRWWSLGLEAISKGEVCALVMGGGQGTRLGFPGPKGMYDLGLPSGKTLFQLFAERLHKLQLVAAATFPRASATTTIPFFVMTSVMNHEDTIAFFREHDFFGLREDQFFFFPQGMLPCFTTDGKLILESSSKLATASDGNGGIYKALAQSGGLDRLKRRGVKYLHVFSVDNALCKVADPTFIGYCIDKKADCGNKVVWKSRANESVGVVAKRDGKFCVVEYSEMDKAASELTDPTTGNLVYGAANICNHFFTTYRIPE